MAHEGDWMDLSEYALVGDIDGFKAMTNERDPDDDIFKYLNSRTGANIYEDIIESNGSLDLFLHARGLPFTHRKNVWSSALTNLSTARFIEWYRANAFDGFEPDDMSLSNAVHLPTDVFSELRAKWTHLDLKIVAAAYMCAFTNNVSTERLDMIYALGGKESLVDEFEPNDVRHSNIVACAIFHSTPETPYIQWLIRKGFKCIKPYKHWIYAKEKAIAIYRLLNDDERKEFTEMLLLGDQRIELGKIKIKIGVPKA